MMAIEIERKFLVLGDAWRAQSESVQLMAQAYLNDAEALRDGRQNVSMRVRISGESAMLNIKSRELGASRQEFEYPISLADAKALLALSVGGRVEKRRHTITWAGHLWEIDEFIGENAGLVVAEIELAAPDEPFERPSFIGAEVTEDLRYYNISLASRPYAQWSEEEKNPCL